MNNRKSFNTRQTRWMIGFIQRKLRSAAPERKGDLSKDFNNLMHKKATHNKAARVFNGASNHQNKFKRQALHSQLMQYLKQLAYFKNQELCYSL